MALPNEHQLKFNSYKDAKTLMQAIENRFRGNTATKKTQKNLLKQQYENFAASSTEVIEQTYERLQKLISQLEMHEIETLSLDDLFNNLKAYESEVNGTSCSTTNSHNVAFLSFSITNNATRAVNTAQGVEHFYAEKSARSFLKKTGRKAEYGNNRKEIGFDTSKGGCFNVTRGGHFIRSGRAPRKSRQRNRKLPDGLCQVKETTSNGS
ncbi:hypothetical protein Tco_0689315 [Tanacetum coccineum]